MHEIDDYLNWFEATSLARPSGEFAEYLKAANGRPRPNNRDGIRFRFISMRLKCNSSVTAHAGGSLGDQNFGIKKFAPPDAQSSCGLRNYHVIERDKKGMKIKEKIDQLAAAGYILLWLLGVPIPVLLLFFLLRGCT